MIELFRDARYGLRQLLQSPGFTLAAVLCLALGIGANAAAFSFARAILFQNAPVSEPERLVRMYLQYPGGLSFGSWSHPEILDLQETAPELFESVTSSGINPFSLSVDGNNQRLWGFYVTGNYFDALGVPLAAGRGFLPEEDVTDATHPVTVISYPLWQRAFGGDPEVVGRSVRVNGRELTVVGVAPADFISHNTAMGSDLWIPFRMLPALDPVRSLEWRGAHWLDAVVRLRPGVTPEQAKAAADAMFASLEEEYPEQYVGVTVRVYTENEAALHPMVRSGFVAMLSLLSAVVGFILLLACANVAGLLVARATSRRREIGIRLALGAGRARLVRQLITESLLLSGLGGALGLGLGALLIRLVSTFRPPTDLPIEVAVGLDAAALGFTFVVTVATGVIFGLVPALQTTRQDLVEAIKDGTSGAGAGSGSRLRQALVVGQVALSLVLLIAAGMVLRSLERVGQLDIGLDPEGVVVASLDPALQGHDEDTLRTFWSDLRRDIETRPGVEAMGYAETLPLSLMNSQSSILPEGYEVPEGQDWPSLDNVDVEYGYFEAMNIPFLRGRAFTRTDDDEAPRVMIVNQAFADRFWPGEDPLGKTADTGDGEYEIIGVVPTGKYFSLGEDPKPYYYRHLPQREFATARFVVVRTAGDPSAQLDMLRTTVGDLDPDLPVSDLGTMRDALGIAYMPVRLASVVIGAFALLALLLAGIGLYGVISYGVGQQVREIGVRMALGARGGDVTRMIVRHGLRLTAVGLVFGVIGGALITRVAAGALYGVSATDPVAYGTAIGVLLAASLTATLLPARRATRVDPLLALRAD